MLMSIAKKTLFGETPLQFVCRYYVEEDINVAHLLLEGGADVSLPNICGEPPSSKLVEGAICHFCD